MSEQIETLQQMPCQATDAGAADFMGKTYHENIKYVWGVGWYRYTGTRWVYDEAAGVQFVRKLTRLMYHLAAKIEDADIRRALAEFATTCESASRIRSIEFLARHNPQLCTTMDAFDADPMIFNCVTGTIDARTWKVRKHCPADLITKLSPVAFDPKAEAPIFTKFFYEILGENPELIEYVHRVLGMTLTGDIREQYLWIFCGSGANGKSTLMDIFAYIMGDYFGLAAEGLLVAKGRDEHPTEFADLQGRRAVLASETDHSRLKNPVIKRLTGDGKVKGRKMRQDFYEFDRTFKTFIMSNNRPHVSEDSEAMWRRIRLVPFTVTIPLERRDTQLTEKLRVEASGILNYFLAGCMAWQEHGLGNPEAVQAATAGYRAESDPLKDFIEDKCVVSPEGWATTDSLYKSYCESAEASHEKPMVKRQFVEALGKRAGIEAKRTNRGRGWAGIALIDLYTHGGA